MSKQPRILVIAHGHPHFSLGGGEVAAFSLFEGYRSHPAIGEAFFIARSPLNDESGKISLYGDNQYLWSQSLGNEFYMEGRDRYSMTTAFLYFLQTVKPDIIHFHHCIHLGYELLEVVKRAMPETRIYFTLHEFLPICHNHGQMLKTGGGLCHKSGVEDCSLCFPEKKPEDFWQRKRRLLHYFGHVDKFIAPSDFLRQRYIDWGIAGDRIQVLENGLRNVESRAPRHVNDQNGRNRYGFFGQINPYKGLPVLLEAVSLLDEEQRKKIVLEVHGANLESQPKQFRQLVEQYRRRFEGQGCLRWVGPYQMHEAANRMAGIDWMVIPSIWWENSPVTIQEAFAVGRPVLASRLGGMAEKVRDGVDGLHVEAGNPRAWADMFMETCGNDDLWERLRAGIPAPCSVRECVDGHLALMGIV